MIVLCAAARTVLAGDFTLPVTMTSETQLGEAAELQFDPGTAKVGKLLILGNNTAGAQTERKFTYDLSGGERKTARGATVVVSFDDKESLEISCDPMADNCISSGFDTENGSTFSISWTTITNH
ncbi:MAG: hypothetical protein CBARDCOR_5123 [uncultured Caballeronia sp.]|nr:MAG: hypothetical protein CBARDCOR_5123 [uncultured Caballeronia sp.]